VEGHEIAIAPSATLSVQWNARAAQPVSRHSSILLVSSPSAVESLGLPELRGAEREVQALSRLYANARWLRASDTGARSLLEIAPQYDVVHFAGHAVVDLRTPAESKLMLGPAGVVLARDIERTRFARTQLVVLGGCSTSSGRAHRSEGVLSLARSFLAAGVPAVVGTVAPVDDTAAARLLVAFHRAYAAGANPAAALRAAQLEMLHSNDPELSDPVHWALFEVVVGGAGETGGERKETTSWASR
jgi:CHAT domain-containing protein